MISDCDDCIVSIVTGSIASIDTTFVEPIVEDVEDIVENEPAVKYGDVQDTSTMEANKIRNAGNLII